MVGVIDYGRGNLRSVINSLKAIGVEAKLVDMPEDLGEIDKLIFPGVGAFKDCMNFLESRKMDTAILKYIESGKLFLGICLGFQVLFEKSEEFGTQEGLGIFKGRVRKFSGKQKVPHMGWNNIQIKKSNQLLSDIADGTYFYFVHSYFVEPEEEDVVSCLTSYGDNFLSMVGKDNVFGTQFHPEKSQIHGLKILKNFIAYK